MHMSSKESISIALTVFDTKDTYSAALNFWQTLGYNSDRQPEDFRFRFADFNSTCAGSINPDKAMAKEWQELCLLFQITDAEMKNHFDRAQQEMIPGLNLASFEAKNIKSYLFASLSLSGTAYKRSTLAYIARQINKQYAIPLIILFHYNGMITIAVVSRRQNRKDSQKDVLEKVTLIKDIKTIQTHRAHIEILHDLSMPILTSRHSIGSFDALHKAWTTTLDIKELNKRFYKELSNWYFWALTQVEFPIGEETEKDKRDSISLIRLLTRMIFVWFMKEKALVPEELFDKAKLDTIIKYEDFNGSTYYKAILQNLFFATLNTETNTDRSGSRRFRSPICGNTNPDFNVHTVFRYQNLFRNPQRVIDEYFGNIPFLNGGLFECLDDEIVTKGKKEYIRIDGFSDRDDNLIKVPDILFFLSDEQDIDLNPVYGTKNKTYKVRGLLNILNSYKFTVAENTPVEEEVALDPELLGRVFENLLASYNPETKNTARHETGSFYTPREIVDYMVEESLIHYLLFHLPHDTIDQKEDSIIRLRFLLQYNEKEHLFDAIETSQLIKAIDNLKAIDPACGSGAFLMGLLLKMVHILHKLDPQNKAWKDQQIANIQSEIESTRRTITDPKVREEIIAKLKSSIIDVEETFEDYDFDYSRKLFLIERCIYGVDIQPIAIQISKLRFFVSLLVDQYPKTNLYNQGIRSLPNLETNLVAANSLISLNLPEQMTLFDNHLDRYQSALKAIHSEYFTTRNRHDKQELKKREETLRIELIKNLSKDESLDNSAGIIAAWNPYAGNTSADFFDPRIMFGFDTFKLVIANPPYIRQEDITNKDQIKAAGYEVFNSTSDIYTYFYELAFKLLSEHGIATYITSNKWLRSKYGNKLRHFTKTKTAIHHLVDFGGYKVFSSATVDTNVLLFSKTVPNPANTLQFVNIPANLNPDLLENYLYEHRVSLKQSTLNDNGWTLADDKVLALKQKIEVAGKPLKDWDVNIYRGVLTGCNEAFIIDTPTKERLCAEDPKSIEIIKPILRGRDIHRYHYKWAGLWLLFIPWHFPLHKDPSIEGASQQAELAFLDQYPAIYNHLLKYKNLLEKRNQAETGIRYEWYALQRCAATYYNEFEKEKVVWADIAIGSCFSIDSSSFYISNTAYMITGNNLHFLIGVLNSRVFDFYFRLISSGLSEKANRGFKIFIEQFPIPVISDTVVADKVNRFSVFIDSKERNGIGTNNNTLPELSAEIDRLVYSLYDLTPDEIAIIESMGL